MGPENCQETARALDLTAHRTIEAYLRVEAGWRCRVELDARMDSTVIRVHQPPAGQLHDWPGSGALRAANRNGGQAQLGTSPAETSGSTSSGWIPCPQLHHRPLTRPWRPRLAVVG